MAANASYFQIGGGYPVHDLSDLSLIWMAVGISLIKS